MATNTLPRQRGNPLRKSVPRAFQYLVLCIVTLIIVVPIVVLLFGSLKTTGEMYVHPYTPPIPPHWENFGTILALKSPFWVLLRNSLLVSLATTAGVLCVCS